MGAIFGKDVNIGIALITARVLSRMNQQLGWIASSEVILDFFLECVWMIRPGRL